MTAIAWLIWVPVGIVAALVFGALATAIQLLAPWAVRRYGGPAEAVTRSYAVGLMLRIFGVALFAVAVTTDRATFPPGPAALGYLGTLLPLLWLETRLA